MEVLKPHDLRRWHCLAACLLTVVYALACARIASAAPVDDDIAQAQQTLPAGHPCRAGITVRWTPELRDNDGDTAGATAPMGHLADGTWTQRKIDGGSEPLYCAIFIDPEDWAKLSRCDQRRTVFHEVGHLMGLKHTKGGIMDPRPWIRERVAVPGCPAVLEPLRDRVTAAVLRLLPTGYGASCGPLRGRVMHCTADQSGKDKRRFRVRVWDRRGSGFTIVRVRAHR